jgi:hypothetical protein
MQMQLSSSRFGNDIGSQSDNGVVPNNVGGRRLCSVMGQLEPLSLRIAIWNRG